MELQQLPLEIQANAGIQAIQESGDGPKHSNHLQF